MLEIHEKKNTDGYENIIQNMLLTELFALYFLKQCSAV